MTMNKFLQITDERIFIGIDVAKDSLALFIDSANQSVTCLNQKQDLRKLAKQLKQLNPTLIVLEATGGYENLAVSVFRQFKLPVAVVFPKRVRQFALGLGLIAKTDEIDAQIISYYGRTANIEPQTQPPEHLIELKALTTRRSQLLEIKIAEQNRLETAPALMKKEIKKHLAFLENQMQNLDRQIQHQIENAKDLAEKDQIMQTVPGVGKTFSSTLLSDLPELGALSNKQISSLVGVAPFPHESGKYKGKRFCRGGRNSIRKVLYMATLAAVRFNPVIKQFYEHLLAKGKLKKVALIACAGKLMTFLNSMVKNNSLWSPKVTQLSA
jgi:transposase